MSLQCPEVSRVLFQERSHSKHAYRINFLRFRHGPVDVLSEIRCHLEGSFQKRNFKLLHRNRMGCDSFVDEHAVCQVAKNAAQRLHTVVLHNELHHQHRLVVGKHDVLPALCLKKRLAHLTDRRERLLFNDHLPIRRGHRLSPERVALNLFVNRDALAQPTRHFVLSRGQGNHVAILMPQCRFPVILSGRDTTGAVHRHHGSEANSQQPLSAKRTE